MPDAPAAKFTDARQARDANRYINIKGKIYIE